MRTPTLLSRTLSRRRIWLALAASVLGVSCAPTSSPSTEQAHSTHAGLEETAGNEREVSGAGETPPSTDQGTERDPAATTAVTPARPTEAAPVVSAAAPQEPEAEEPCTAPTPAEFLAECLDSGCAPLRQRLRGYTFYSCEDDVPWEVWGSRQTPEGLTLIGPLVAHNTEEELASYSVLEERRVEAIERRVIGDQSFFFTAVSYVISGEVPDSRGREPLYELSAAVLVSVCREDGTCPIQNATAWYGSHEVRRAYRPSDAALARRGMDWRSAIAIEGTRVAVTRRYRNLGYQIPDDVVSADVGIPRAGAATPD